MNKYEHQNHVASIAIVRINFHRFLAITTLPTFCPFSSHSGKKAE